MIYKFIDNKGTFKVYNPHKISYLYFPLTNDKGEILSCISPNLAGDINKDNETFLTPPASIEDIKHNLLVRRDFFLKITSSKNKILRLSQAPKQSLEAGLLYHKLTGHYFKASIEIVNFVPCDLGVEVMWIKIKNKGSTSFEFIPTSFIPLYGRSQENLRDHRHVSSLLNRIQLNKFGIILKPTMIFQEQGHSVNKTSYFVLGYRENKIAPSGQFPTLLSFCGEEGNIVRPDAIFKDAAATSIKSHHFDGKEACAAFRFPKEKLKKNKEVNYILIMGITDNPKTIKCTLGKLNSIDKVEKYLEKTKNYWQNLTKDLQFDFKDTNYNGWLRWVVLQPTLRKLFGCSFLPHFDYGKGGRGWRDIWQDALNLLLVEQENTRKLIINNFKGVRIDGSNATIITKKGRFISDRNNISRVWMDHGIWPYLTLKEYIHRTGDVNILLNETIYFRDHQLKRAKESDLTFNQNDYILRTKNNKTYKGTILEHILIENLVQFFNVGRHNITKLENADWNDGLDMAPQKGESVAFSCMYAYNLGDLCSLLEKVKEKTETVQVLEELMILLDRLQKPVDYNDYRKKQTLLEAYLEKTKQKLSGKKKTIRLNDLISDLNKKSLWLKQFIRKKEWLKQGFFNGYYDNRGKRVEGKIKGNIRMMLASQVFAIMSGVASDNQIRKIWHSIKKHLKDPKLKGFRLNTNFKTLYMDLGRAFGFSYGDKENGAFFNHMIVMLSFALYERGFIKEGYEALNSIYQMVTSPAVKIYPQLPEYFNFQGRGLYFYLTGSASWYIHTLLSQILGIQCSFGDLIIKPALTKNNFFKKRIELKFTLHRRKLKLIYIKENNNNFFKIACGYLENKKIIPNDGKLTLTKTAITKLAPAKEHTITVFLD